MKKRFILIIVFGILIICLSIGIYFLKGNLKNNNNNFDNTQKELKFNVSKIQYYSNVGAISNQTTYQNPEWDLNVYQYTDIAIYLERIVDYDVSNYIKSLYINNIYISESKKGNQKLYYLNPLNFGNNNISDLEESNEIKDTLEYNIMNYENKDNDVKYSIPIFFEDCSNPITLRYVNLDILNNYKIANTEQIKFDGSLLKTANIDLEEIKSKINIDLNLVTENDENHNISLSLDIPLEEGENSIFDGDISIIKEKLKNNF